MIALEVKLRTVVPETQAIQEPSSPSISRASNRRAGHIQLQAMLIATLDGVRIENCERLIYEFTPT